MKQTSSTSERKLTINEILSWLINDRLISIDEEQAIRQFSVRWENREKDLIEIIYDYQVEKDSKLGKKFTADKLSKWLAARIGLPLFYIDPLRIDVTAVTSVCTQPYAERFNILPVKIDDDVITVAVSEPFIHEWEKDLKQIHKKKL